MIKIKICGVKSLDIAAQAVALGANYIGLVFHPASKRHVDLALAKTIAKATVQAGATPVAVFVNQNLEAMQAILDTTDITVVQLHGDNAKASHHQLAADYTRIYVQAVNTDGSPVYDATGGLQHCLPERDYLLIDNLEAGKGTTLPWDKLEQDALFHRGLAGGLNPTNVATAIEQVKPDFVDVSSGVETVSGEKDLTLIAAFIQQVRGHSYAHE